MKLQLDLPGIVRVRDTHNYKGVPMTVLSIFGVDVLYYTGKSTLDNESWEEIATLKIAEFMADTLMRSGSFSDSWSPDNPTGREVSETDPVVYLTEDRDDG